MGCGGAGEGARGCGGVIKGAEIRSITGDAQHLTKQDNGTLKRINYIIMVKLYYRCSPENPPEAQEGVGLSEGGQRRL